MLGVLLTGVVAIQVEVLKLGASIGRSMSLATELQSHNQLLRFSVARLADDHRIMRKAAAMGMVMPGPTEVTFIGANGSNAIGKAISTVQPPAPTSFLSNLAAQESADGVANAALGASGPTTTTTSAIGASAVPSSGTSGTTASGGQSSTATSTGGAASASTSPAGGATPTTAGTSNAPGAGAATTGVAGQPATNSSPASSSGGVALPAAG